MLAEQPALHGVSAFLTQGHGRPHASSVCPVSHWYPLSDALLAAWQHAKQSNEEVRVNTSITARKRPRHVTQAVMPVIASGQVLPPLLVGPA